MFIEAKTNFIEGLNIPRISAPFANSDSVLGNIKQTFLMTMNNGNVSESGKFSIVSFLFGCTPSAIVSARPFEFDLLYQSGLLGYLALLGIIFMGIRQGRKYLLEESDDMGYRLIVIALLIAGFLYLSFNNDEAPFIYSGDFDPLSRRSLFFGLIMLLGLTYRGALKEAKE